MLCLFRLAACAAALIASHAYAQVTVTEPWVRGTVPQQKATGAFMKLESTKPIALVGAASPLAGAAEVHEMVVDKNVMRMRPVAHIDLAPGKPVELKPGSYHVMLFDLKQPLRAGEHVPLTLTFENADKSRQTVEVNAEVRALGAAQGDQPMKH